MIKLMSYQRLAVDWMKSKDRALLSLDMGLGKTCVTITALKELNITDALVIVPAILKINWSEEIKKFSDLKWVIPKTAKDILPNHLNIVSYEFVMTHASKIPTEWDAIVCDESHYLKNPKSKRTQTILGTKGLVHCAKKVYMLSGTPMPNHAGELWAMLFTFGQTKLKYNDFIRTYLDSYDNAWGATIITGMKRGAEIEIKKMLSPIMYKKTKEDVALDLPPISYHYLNLDSKKITISQIEIDKNLRSMFLVDKTSEEFLTELNKETQELKKILESTNDIDVINMLSATAQGIATIRRFTGIQKALEILPLIKEELSNREYKKLVIFAVHRKIIEYTAMELSEFGAKCIFGDVAAKERDAAIKEFQDPDSKCQVLVCGIGTAGIGLNLTAGSEVVMLELAFTPAYNSQAVMRCHRIGQKNNVRVRFIQLKNSLDARITEILVRKMRESDLIFS